MNLRSDQWFRAAPDISFQHRAAMRAIGHLPDSYIGKPIVGIFNSWNDLNSCNYPHKELVEYVKRGVLLAGGYPVELHTITTAADFMKSSDLPYRNLMSMDIEELIRSLPLDGVVLLCECDKTTPAQLMAAASCDIPALQLAAGHRTSGTYRGKTLNYGTDLWKVLDERRAGQLDASEWMEIEKCMNCSLGGCPVMGTASTMKSISEVLGMMLPGTSSIPANHAQRKEAAELTGRRIVEMVKEGLTPSKLMTPDAFDNAIKLLAAIGGSTNAVLHLTAIAGRLGIDIELEQYAKASNGVPLLVNLQPSGAYNMDDFYESGGLSAVIQQLLPYLNRDCLAATGESIEIVYRESEIFRPEVIATIDHPFKFISGIAVVKGNLAPQGAILKRSAASDGLFIHKGQAVVFDGYQDMMNRIDSDELDVDKDSVLVLKNCGPVAEGMPEWGSIPIPKKLLQQGVTDMVRISDARMSGTSYGTIILHVSPEAFVGGALAVVRNGDVIDLDVQAGRLDLLIEDTELNQRMEDLVPRQHKHQRGYLSLFAHQVQQAHEGCDLKFLRPRNEDQQKFIEPTVGKG
ncbi:dihydroxy-acid dehydratase [Cohnella suwonensis]|uniref:Dihydroxy-acid dehydratase n=1 Tax=Cohnella suwonensis TaxID=696072 RepID=A0ABW0M094_9BACL